MATPIKAQEAIAPAINLKPKTKIRGRQGGRMKERMDVYWRKG